MVARRVLREKYLQADVGITGANFAIAETGMLSITENEGNARLTAALPRDDDHAGRDREGAAAARRPGAVPADAGGDGHRARPSVVTTRSMAGRASRAKPTARRNITWCCSTTIAPPCWRMPSSAIRCTASVAARASMCARSFAMSAAIPTARPIAGRLARSSRPTCAGSTSGSTFPTPRRFAARARETCPVKINLHHHLLQNRRNASRQKPSWWQKIAFKAFAPVATKPALWSLVTKMGRLGQRAARSGQGQPPRPGLCLDQDTRSAAHRPTDFQGMVEDTPMSERDNILARIREALAVRRPRARP